MNDQCPTNGVRTSPPRSRGPRLVACGALLGGVVAVVATSLHDARMQRRELDESSDRWHAVETELRQRIAAIEGDSGRREDSLRTRLDAITARFDDIDLAAPLRPIARAAQSSIFLLRCSYVFRERGPADEWSERRGSTWGTAFCVTSEGHLVTSKHLVEPWKFDAELCALVALGEVEVDGSRAEVVAWRAGTRFLDEDGAVDPNRGYSSVPAEGGGRLTIWSRAPDAFEEQTTSIGGMPIRHRIHRPDRNDLAVLKLEGGPFAPLDCAPDSSSASVGMLDPVVTLGFPRGRRGIEDAEVRPSCAIGIVRRAGETIHTTTPMVSGNSGGPLLNEAGRVIGVATSVYSETQSICVRIGSALELLAAPASAPAALTASTTTGTAVSAR